MQIDPNIRHLIKKNRQYNKNYHFYWIEKDGEFKIIAEYGVIYDLVVWAMNVWELECNKAITALDEDGSIAYFTIGGKHGKAHSQFGYGT